MVAIGVGGRANVSYGLAVKSAGTVWEWSGSNAPAQVPTLSGIVAVAGGIAHSLGLEFLEVSGGARRCAEGCRHLPTYRTLCRVNADRVTGFTERSRNERGSPG